MAIVYPRFDQSSAGGFDDLDSLFNSMRSWSVLKLPKLV